MNHRDEQRWQAVESRDSGESGRFVYAVKTTGVYCRPGCSSRLPNRENTEFFDNAAAAENAGFRPCKRCRPESAPVSEEYTAIIVSACRQIMSRVSHVSPDNLAARANMSPGHFHRLFKKITGITPGEFSAGVQSERFLNALDEGKSVTEAVYVAGYSTPGRAYDQLKKHTSVTPGTYRNGTPGVAIRYAVAECSLGWVTAAATERGICAILFSDRRDDLPEMIQERFPLAEIEEIQESGSGILAEAVSLADRPQPAGVRLPLDIAGTVFQKKVWNALMEIPSGETASYGDIALKIGSPKAVRAVAGACAANRIALLIPCHRVIRRDGSTGGYRWGSRRKEILLRRERENAGTRQHGETGTTPLQIRQL